MAHKRARNQHTSLTAGAHKSSSRRPRRKKMSWSEAVALMSDEEKRARGITTPAKPDVEEPSSDI